MKIRGAHGFTLIELMIVVIILAALAGMIIPRIVPRSKEALRKIALADIGTLTTQLKLFYLDNGFYPKDLRALLSKPPKAKNWREPYVDHIKDPWGREYRYKYPGTHTAGGFDLYSLGEDGTANTDDDVSNWKGLGQ
jgi:general secretion pathway protein G